MPNPSAIQDLASLIQIIGVITIVTIAWKWSRREAERDAKLNNIEAVVTNTRDSHLHEVRSDMATLAREVRDSNAKVIEAVRDSGDRIVQAIITLKS
jgi:hypothetical protein